MTERRARQLILAAGWALALAYAFPGLMSPDSFSQLVQARREWPVGDWHPPVMVEIWRYIDAVLPGPFGMLLLQTGTFLFGLDALLRRAMAPVTAAIVAACVLLWPPVLATMGVIWKDSQMAGFLLAGTAAIASERRWHRVAGMGLLCIATAMRYNAVAATLPLIVLLAPASPSRLRRYALAIASWIAITAIAFAANAALTERKDHPWHNSLALFDIVGTIRYSPDYADADIERDLAGTPLVVHDHIVKHCRAAYTPTGHYWMTHGDRRIFDLPGDQHLAEVAAAWKTVVTTHVVAWLHHRWSVFREVLGFHNDMFGAVWTSFADPDQAKGEHVANRHSALQDGWQAAATWLATTWLFRPDFYLLLALAMLPLCRSRLGRAILASGVLNELALFPVAPSPDYRYSHWLVVTAVAGVAIAFRSRYHSGTPYAASAIAAHAASTTSAITQPIDAPPR